MKSNLTLIIVIILCLFELWIGFKFIDNDDILIYHTATFSFTIVGMVTVLLINLNDDRVVPYNLEELIRLNDEGNLPKGKLLFYYQNGSQLGVFDKDYDYNQTIPTP